MADDRLRDEGLEQEVKGTGNELKGKAQKNLGKLTGDRSDEMKGRVKEGAGKIQKETGRLAQDLDRDTRE